NSICTNGVDEQCTLDLSVSNQPSCENTILGIDSPLSGQNVTDIAYVMELVSLLSKSRPVV
ncbi:hypothetical protein KCU81_g10146, partial [Aureobasidium melanogenum]